MALSRFAHYAIYGNVAIPRAICPDCQRYAFILEGRFACCDLAIPKDLEIHKKKRMSHGDLVRDIPDRATRKTILSGQSNCCFYCNHRFGFLVYRKTKRAIRLRVTWDHLVPFSYSGDNSSSNFVAACQLCNSFKSALMFSTKEEARIYVTNRWRQEMQTLPADLYPD